MFARMIDGIWREHLDAVRQGWERLTRRGDDRVRTGLPPPNDAPLHRRIHRKLIGSLSAVLAVLVLTYSAASALVNGAANSSTARTDYFAVLQAASAQYRLARAECLALPFERREACVAEAHADESRMRNAAISAPRKQLTLLRLESNQLLLASAAQDSIVIEPACNVVIRGSASVCEIQVKGAVLETEMPATTRRMDSTVAARSVRPVDPAYQQSALLHRVGAAGGEQAKYFANVATALSH